jgi:hypothetical protein
MMPESRKSSFLESFEERGDLAEVPPIAPPELRLDDWLSTSASAMDECVLIRVPPGCPSGAELDGIGWNSEEKSGTTNLGNSKRWWGTTCPA